jgi:hypothetical protein
LGRPGFIVFYFQCIASCYEAEEGAFSDFEDLTDLFQRFYVAIHHFDYFFSNFFIAEQEFGGVFFIVSKHNFHLSKKIIKIKITAAIAAIATTTSVRLSGDWGSSGIIKISPYHAQEINHAGVYKKIEYR